MEDPSFVTLHHLSEVVVEELSSGRILKGAEGIELIFRNIPAYAPFRRVVIGKGVLVSSAGSRNLLCKRLNQLGISSSFNKSWLRLRPDTRVSEGLFLKLGDFGIAELFLLNIKKIALAARRLA